MLGLLPECLRTGTGTSIKGAKYEVASPIVTKLARHHIKDMVSGREPSWPKETVANAQLTAEVLDTPDGQVFLRYEGRVDLYHKGTWGLASNMLRIERSLNAKLLGYATYDAQKNRFVSFDLVATRTRRGAGPSNMRRQTADIDPNPMGILFQLAGDSPAERIRPGSDYRD